MAIALSQLSRPVEYRSNKRPQLADLRPIAAIEQNADLVIFLTGQRVMGLPKMNMVIQLKVWLR